MRLRNPRSRSTIPGNTSTNRSTSAAVRRPADGDPQRVIGVDAHRGEHRRRLERLATSTTTPSARRRRAGRARAGSARPRRRRTPRHSRWGSDASGSGRRSARRRARVDAPAAAVAISARCARGLARRRRRRAHAAPKPTHAGTFSMPPRRARSCAPPTSERREPQPAAHEQRAGALRPAELVRGDRAEVGAERGERRRDVAGRRARVDVHERRRARAPRAHTSAAGCSVPTSWFASCTRHEHGVGAHRGDDLRGVEAAGAGRRRRP